MECNFVEKASALLTTSSAHCSENDLRMSLDEFLACCQGALNDFAQDKQMEVFLEVAYVLEKLPGNSQIWSWLKGISHRADQIRRDALRIALFELVPEEPIREQDLLSLWSFMEEAGIRWAVRDAYTHCPHKLEEHYLLYANHRNKSGKAVPNLSILRL